jgi:hypothetical protein
MVGYPIVTKRKTKKTAKKIIAPLIYTFSSKYMFRHFFFKNVMELDKGLMHVSTLLPLGEAGG